MDVKAESAHHVPNVHTIRARWRHKRHCNLNKQYTHPAMPGTCTITNTPTCRSKRACCQYLPQIGQGSGYRCHTFRVRYHLSWRCASYNQIQLHSIHHPNDLHHRKNGTVRIPQHLGFKDQIRLNLVPRQDMFDIAEHANIEKTMSTTEISNMFVPSSAGNAKMTPSPPMPKLRSHSFTAWSGVTLGSGLSRLSTKMKSLPSPCNETHENLFSHHSVELKQVHHRWPGCDGLCAVSVLIIQKKQSWILGFDTYVKLKIRFENIVIMHEEDEPGTAIHLDQ